MFLSLLGTVVEFEYDFSPDSLSFQVFILFNSSVVTDIGCLSTLPAAHSFA